MKQRLLLGIAVFGLVGVAGFAGTLAFFSDTETSAGNVFAAGSIDLTVDHARAVYNGVDCETCSLTLYSGDENTEVVDGSDNATEQNFPFSAPEVDPHPAWATHANADWIWATSPTAVGDDGSNGDVSYTFERTFNWQGNAGDIDFELGVGADNSYEVFLNGTSVAVDTDEDNYSSIDVGDFSANLQNGVNTLQIVVTNQENTQGNNTPEANPGGLLYFLEIEKENCNEDLNFQQWCQLWEAKNLANETFFDFGDVKPGDNGSNVISLHVDNNDAYMCLDVTNKENDDNGLTDPESEVDSTGGDGEGELGEHIMFFAWDDTDADGEFDSGETPLMNDPAYINDISSIPFADSVVNGAMTGGSTEHLGLKWCAGDMTVTGNTIDCDGIGMGNIAQTDSFLADLQFHAVQSRNNDGFVCEGSDGSGSIGCTDEADVMLVLDSSGSIGSDMSTLQTAAKSFVDTLAPSTGGVEVGVVDFDSSATVIQELTGDGSAAKTAIDTLNSFGGTNVGNGIKAAQDHLDSAGRATAPDFILIVNDGDTSDASFATSEATDSKDAGTTIFAVGVGDNIDPTFLQDNIVSSPSEDHYFHADNFEDIETEFAEILSCEVGVVEAT